MFTPVKYSQPVHAVAGQADLAAVVPGRLELTELPPDHFVTRAVIAGNIDPANIGPSRGISLQDQCHAVVDPIDFRASLDACKCKTIALPKFSVKARVAGDVIGIERLARLDGHQGLELVFLAQKVAFKRDRGNDEALPSV